MVRLIPLLDARTLAGQNKDKREALIRTQKEATERAEQAEKKLNAAYTTAFDAFLAPFAAQFARIKNVELGELTKVGVVPEMQKIDVKVREVGLDAVQGLASLAGGGLAGAAAGGLTFAAVGAFATASTGAAIGGLSGAAATSATLAWLGGGSLAAGGGGVAAGGVVLAGIVAAPVLLAVGGFLWWQGERAYDQQREIKEQLRQAKADLMPRIAKADLANKRALDTASVVKKLAKIGRRDLPALRQVIELTDDYRAFTDAEKERLAEIAGLATTIASVIACPILDDNGDVTTLSTEAVQAARALGERLAA